MTFLKNIYFQLVLALCFAANTTIAQDTQPQAPLNNNQINTNEPKQFEKFKDRLYLGGTVGAWFGTTTYVNLSPILGIKINKKFSVGVGAIYNYYSQTYALKKYVSTI